MAVSRKRPALLWYTGDWLKDPHLAICSPATRGIWMDALCLMHENGESGTITGTVVGLARACRCSPQEFSSAVDELEVSGVCPRIVRGNSGGSHETVTLINRRMVRESEERKSARQRKMRERERKRDDRSHDCHKDVTLPLSVTSSVSPSVTGKEETPHGVSSGSPFGEGGGWIMWERVIARWNALASADGRPKVQSLNETRRKHYRARLRSTPDLWEILEREIPLLSEHAKSSKSYCTFPWLIKSQENLDKLAEGNYRAEDRIEPGAGAGQDVWPFPNRKKKSDGQEG